LPAHWTSKRNAFVELAPSQRIATASVARDVDTAASSECQYGRIRRRIVYGEAGRDGYSNCAAFVQEYRDLSTFG
jgi:hypothetical protein